MTLRVLLGGLLGGIALFVWGFLYWGVLDLPYQYMPTLQKDAAVARYLDASIRESGTYVFPARDEDAEATKARYAHGPVGMIFIRKDGVDIAGPAMYVKGLLFLIASAAIAAAITATVLGSLPRYGSRVLFVFRLGLFAGVAIEIGKVFWWHYPGDFVLVNCVYHFIGWALAGAAIAAVVKPPVADAPA